MEIKTIGVIGAGTMGRGIAYAAALGGYRTVLEDVSPEMLEQGTAYISQALGRRSSAWKSYTGAEKQSPCESDHLALGGRTFAVKQTC